MSFDKLVDLFLDSGELGDYNKKDFSLTLYDIKNDRATIKGIKRRVNKITLNYKLIVLYPDREYSNIKILDIDL